MTYIKQETALAPCVSADPCVMQLRQVVERLPTQRRGSRESLRVQNGVQGVRLDTTAGSNNREGSKRRGAVMEPEHTLDIRF